MHEIRKAKISDSKTIAQLASQTFIESHGHSAKKESIAAYVNKHYTEAKLTSELSNQEFVYFILELNNKAIGFSKITLNVKHNLIEEKNIVLLDRIYILEEFLGEKLGYELFQFNVNYSKSKNQKGMWLHTWVENERAIQFYLKTGFEIIGKYDFQIDQTHSNPNHVMYLKY